VSGRRAVQAEQTRLEILQAARRLFHEQGYSATSLKQIAASAGVSIQTVYDSVGGKAELVRRLNDLVDAEAQVAEIAAEVGTETDLERLVAIPARIACRIVERCGDIVRTCYDAARSDHELLDVVAEGNRRHVAGVVGLVGRMRHLGVLPDAVSDADAARTITVLSDVRVALMLVDDQGLEPDAALAWMTTTLVAAIRAQQKS
jgi:AcrR family transcriptional regulator